MQTIETPQAIAHLINPYEEKYLAACSAPRPCEPWYVTDSTAEDLPSRTRTQHERAIAIYKHQSGTEQAIDYSGYSLSFEVMNARIRQELEMGDEWSFVLSWRDSVPF